MNIIELFNIHYIVKLISKEHVDIGDYPETQEIKPGKKVSRVNW
jgi:hypothetical protein